MLSKCSTFLKKISAPYFCERDCKANIYTQLLRQDNSLEYNIIYFMILFAMFIPCVQCYFKFQNWIGKVIFHLFTPLIHI